MREPRQAEPSPVLDIEMHPVKSEAIKALGHDRASNTLRIEFHSGGTYDYPDVRHEEFQNFAGAGSLGRHFHQHIRKFPSTRVA